MASLTAHCLVKNEENYIRAAIVSVIDFVEKVIVYDTGSTDATVAIVRSLCDRYPTKIIFEEKGECDKARHTALRQEMVTRTTTDWFMVLDGDEVWSIRGMQELVQTINADHDLRCVIAPFYLCVGDVYHYSWRGQFRMRGKRMHATARAFRLVPGVHWSGVYERDDVYDTHGVSVTRGVGVAILTARFWHMTHLPRSPYDEFSSGGNRKAKLVPTYLILGKRILEPLPDVLSGAPALGIRAACCGLVRYASSRLIKRLGGAT